MNPVLQVSNLSHSFSGVGRNRLVLNSINLEIEPAELIILAGPSGCGKTTLLTLVSGLRAVQSGSILLLGEELYRSSSKLRRRLRSQIGMVFQSHQLIPFLTAEENVVLAMDGSDDDTSNLNNKFRRASHLLSLLGLESYAKSFPSQLSGGQSQRVALARAVACYPKFLIADEPTASLDPENTDLIMNGFQNLRSERGVSILMTTHDNRLHRHADRVVNILDGHIS